MSDKNTDKELSMDELKSVSGAGVDFNEPYGAVDVSFKGKVVRKGDETKTILVVDDGGTGVSDEDYNDFVQKI